MGILDNLKERLNEKVQDGYEIFGLRKEEKEKFLGMGVEAYVQNIKETPKVYGELNEENISTLERIEMIMADHLKDAKTYEDDFLVRKISETSAGGLKKLLIWGGADLRFLKNKGKDVNKSGYLKGSKFGFKVYNE